ncbi:hypothetical protein [Moorena sp. SIO4G3]|uniref:hypothetical protein n=1 Tax=Moorena sp. SIO4G3 TaxID=2607821 RepID=UPI00142A4B87|nr:hypothetical protein [Moorena sp. SIO4G3]NEO78698.1 hypothetical protein [Moorena sp. SIO4G3]
MKKLLLKISTLTITFTSIIVGEILISKPVSAYCVYNYSKTTTITAVQLPLIDRSFKEVIQPNNHACCPWYEPTCVAEGKKDKYAKTPFIIYEGNIDEDIRNLLIQDIFTARRVLRKINSDLDPLIQQIFYTQDIPPIQDNIAEQIYSLLDKYVPKERGLGVVQTYNGGIIHYNGPVPLGCWAGPCRGQDINRNGTRGPFR